MNRHNHIHILNRLVRANNNRITCYKSSMLQLSGKKSSDLIPLFRKMIRNCQENKEALFRQLNILDATITDRPTLFFGLKHCWMQLKARLTGSDKRAILNNCGRTEAAVQRVYKKMLRQRDLPYELYALILQQKDHLSRSQHKVGIQLKAQPVYNH